MDFNKLNSLLSRVSNRRRNLQNQNWTSGIYDFFLQSSQYQNVQATKKDVTDALTQYRGLSFRSDKYVFNDGTQKELVNLNGTIPVNYKSEIFDKQFFFSDESSMSNRFFPPFLRQHLSLSHLRLAHGHASLQRAHLLRQTNGWNAYKSKKNREFHVIAQWSHLNWLNQFFSLSTF